MAKNSPGSMESKIKAHLVANCPKYDESRFDSCMMPIEVKNPWNEEKK